MFTQQIKKPNPNVGEEYSPWFWNPSNVYTKRAPESFRRLLDEVDPDLEATWNPITERWQIWVRNPRVQAGRGWLYLFPVQDPSGAYLPLDERSIAKIHEISVRKHGSSKAYFDRVVGEQQRDREKKDRELNETVKFEAMDYYGFTQPHVGYGALTGSKVIGQ